MDLQSERISASSPGGDGGGDEHPGSSPDIRPAPGHHAKNVDLLGSAGLPTVGRIRPEGPSCNPTPAWRLEWSAPPTRVTALRWRDGGGVVSRPQGWSSLRNSRLLHVTAGRPPGGKRPFSATGGNADSSPLPGGGGKGVVIPGTLEGGTKSGKTRMPELRLVRRRRRLLPVLPRKIMAMMLKATCQGRGNRVRRPASASSPVQSGLVG